jgi:formylglycine-generating enzyme required for sulfatase activity
MKQKCRQPTVFTVYLLAVVGIFFMGCDNPAGNRGSPFVMVTGITGIPTTGTMGIDLTLNGTISPVDATNTVIVWTVENAGTTGASISGNTLSTTNTGTVTVTATVEDGTAAGMDYTQEFTITIGTFVEVSDITGVPTAGTPEIDLALSGIVSPANASDKTIMWEMKNAGMTGASISGNILSTTNTGTVTVTATITNGLAAGTPYTEDFSITIYAFVPVSEITGVLVSGTAGTNLTLSGTVSPANASNKIIVWTVKNTGMTGAFITENALSTSGGGTVVVTATVTNGTAMGTDYTQDFSITIDAFVPVSSITGVPTEGTVGISIPLSETVVPENASSKNIVWTVKNAGTTGASISGNALTTIGAGTVTVTATIENGTAERTPYTQDFTITINAFVAVTGITGVFTNGTAGISVPLSGTVSPANASTQAIVWAVKNAGTTGATISGNTLLTTNTGTVTVTAAIANGLGEGISYTQDFPITIYSFVVVSGITGVPAVGTAGISMPLSGTVSPANAPNQTIMWTVKNAGTTGASITGNTLSTTGGGAVVVTAIIVDGTAAGTPYTQDFTITVNEFVAVTGITGVPASGTAGISMPLGGTVAPANASSKNIVWTVKNEGGTGATISGNILSTTNTGTVTVTAAITNGLAGGTPYTQDFNIAINAFVPVSSITGVPTTGMVGVGLTLSGTVSPANATNKTIMWGVKSPGGTGASINGNTLSTTNTGTVTVIAIITNGMAVGIPYTQDFSIAINVVPVSSIAGVPMTGVAGVDLTLSGTVMPANATNKTIMWGMKNPGGTGAFINGNTLSIYNAGTVTVTATIINGLAVGTPYTQDFNISIIVPVTEIMSVPMVGVVGVGLTLSGTVSPANATNQTIMWAVKNAGTTGATISGNTLSTTNTGTVTVTAAIANGLAVGRPYTQDFNISIFLSPITVTAQGVNYMLNLVPPGTIGIGSGMTWGSSINYPLPQTITAFYMGEAEITYELWYAVRTWAVSNKGYTFANAGREGSNGTVGAAPTTASQEPVTTISWRDAVVWCNAYSEAVGKAPAYKYNNAVLRESEGSSVAAGSGKAEQAVIDASADGFRLPTEAQWEYAARGGVPGTGTPWTYTYAGSNTIGDVAVYSDNSGNKTAVVKSKAANSLGLYDMSGNVYEWCQNFLYSSSGSNRALRGGSWYYNASYCTVSYRYGSNPAYWYNYIGFRVSCP